MSESGLDDWIITGDIALIVNRIRVIREGIAGYLDPKPEVAMQVLRTFALRRPIEDLLRLQPETAVAGNFAPLDATAVLTLAALIRPVEEAATLAIEQWKMEFAKDPARSPLTDSILHDVTAQRTVQEVAVFIGECRRGGPADLVAKALNAFTMTTLGRTNLDRALLYIALREQQCADDAAEMLRLILRKPVTERSDRATAGSLAQVGVVAALRHFSPSETIVQDWIEREMAVAERELETVDLVADLLMNEPDGAGELAEYVGRTWKPRRLTDLCEILARESPACFTLVRGYATARSDKDSLAEIIQGWDRSEVLAGTLKDLLADVVARGADGSCSPRPIDFLRNLQLTLQIDRASARCRKALSFAAAVHVYGRTGAEIARLLGYVSRREQRRAAQIVNERLTGRLLAGEIDGADFVAYLNGLQQVPGVSTLLTFWALRELSDPTASDHALEGAAWVVGDIAARLRADGWDEIEFDLLERCLENEQWLNAADVIDIVERVRGEIPGERWYSLLSATVGRWAETRRRDEVVEALRNLSFDKEAEAVIHSVQ